MWKSLYDWMLQKATVSWAVFLRQNQTPGRVIRDRFQQEIYQDAGLTMLLLSGLFGLLYYYYLNARFGRYYKQRTWYAIMGLAVVVVGICTYAEAKSKIGRTGVHISSHLLYMSVINACYAAIAFLLWAFVLKWNSPMGKRTPF